MSELTHAELPWSHNIEDETIESAAGFTVAYIIPHANINTVARTGQTHSHADAEFIVRAVNSHDELLAALEGLVHANEEWNKAVTDIIGRQPEWSDSYLDAARAAIAKARGERT